MSILAKMLEKKQETSGDADGSIPPGLVAAVASSGAKKKNNQRYLILGCLAIFGAVAGVFLLSYLQGRSANKIADVPPPATAPPSEQQTAVLPLRSSATIAASSSGNATTPPSEKSNTTAVPTAQNRTTKPLLSVARTNSPQKSVGAVLPLSQPPLTVRGKRLHASSPAPSTLDSAPTPRSGANNRVSTDAHLFAARSAETHHDYALAKEHYLKALGLDPDNYRVLNNLASTSLHLNQPIDALTYANQALSRKPDYVSAMLNAGVAQIRQGNQSEARQVFSKALTTDPLNQGALFNLALLKEQEGDTDEAIRLYRQLSDTGDSRGRLGAARVYEQRGQKEEALRVYREITTLPEEGSSAKEQAKQRIKLLDNP